MLECCIGRVTDNVGVCLSVALDVLPVMYAVITGTSAKLGKQQVYRCRCTEV